jgi:hypothetical protein
MQNKQVFISFIFIFFLSFSIQGQKQVNSPYSRFNLGSIVPSGSYRSLAMGGTGVAMRDNNSIYFVNPSSYSSIDTTSFLLDFGSDYSISILSDRVNKHKSDDMNFGHFLIGFPLSKGWGFATGLVPYSNGYYNISETIKAGDPGYDPLTGEIIVKHFGDGSLTNFFFGTGLNLTKNLSVGANFSILFGQLDRRNQYEFADYANTFGMYSTEKLKVRGVNLNYGAQYTVKISNDYFLTAGMAYTAKKKYKSDLIQLSERFAAYPSSGPDTLAYVINSSRDSTRLPSTVRLGLSFGRKDKFVAGIDWVSSDWANASIHGSSASYLANSKSWLFGIEFIPDKFSNISFLKRIDYRIGGHISDNYLLINGTRIKEYGASCGFGMRLRNSYSKATFFFDFTRKNGDMALGLHNENFYTIGASLNLYDFWFIKRKFD